MKRKETDGIGAFRFLLKTDIFFLFFFLQKKYLSADLTILLYKKVHKTFSQVFNHLFEGVNKKLF